MNLGISETADATLPDRCESFYKRLLYLRQESIRKIEGNIHWLPEVSQIPQFHRVVS